MEYQKLVFIQGEKGSHAQRLNNQWIVSGAHNVFLHTPFEYGYRLNLPINDLFKLPMDTPIHAGVSDFTTFNKTLDAKTTILDNLEITSNITDTFDSVGSLIAAAKESIQNVYQNLDPEEKKHFRVYNMYSVDAIKEIAAALWNGMDDGTSLYTVQDEIENDLYECINTKVYDAYPALLIA